MNEVASVLDRIDPSCPIAEAGYKEINDRLKDRGLEGHAWGMAFAEEGKAFSIEHLRTCQQCAAYNSPGKMGALYMTVATVQFVIHYLGWGGIVLGVVAYLFGNTERGVQLVVSGIGLIVLKYAIGAAFVFLPSLFRARGNSN